MQNLNRLNYILLGGAAMAAYVLYKKPILILPIGFGLYYLSKGNNQYNEKQLFPASFISNTQKIVGELVPNKIRNYIPSLYSNSYNPSEFNLAGQACNNHECIGH